MKSHDKLQHETRQLCLHLGGFSVLKIKDIGANNHYFIGGYYFLLFSFLRAIIM
jgi:hypothetical protein